MATLSEFLRDPDGTAPKQLHLIRLYGDPAEVLVFTDDVEQVLLHWVSDPSVKSFIECPGESCPLCFIGSSPQPNLLLPAYDLIRQRVGVLQIPCERGPGKLLSVLAPHIDGASTTDHFLVISREGRDYFVETIPMLEDGDRGESHIRTFLNHPEVGPLLRSALPQLSRQELARLESVHGRLKRRGAAEKFSHE